MLTTIHDVAARLYQHLDALWELVQVSRCGSYSPARLHAFDAYCRTTSMLRVVAVCVLTPLPSLAFPLLLECIPLVPPRLGWDADANIWIRCAITNTMLTMNFVTQSRQVLPDLDIAPWRVACVSLCTGVSFAGVNMLIAWRWTFPIPFAFVVTAVPFSCLSAVFFAALIGAEPFRRVTQLRAKLRCLCRMFTIQFTLITIYPAYSALFLWLSGEQQTLILLTLPTVKLAMKYLMAKTFRATELEDSIPEITIFSVEIFNALYVCACLQMASSALFTTFIIIAIDVAQLAIKVRSVSKRAARLRALSMIVPSEALKLESDCVINENQTAASTSVKRDEPHHLRSNSRAVHSHTLAMLFTCEFLILGEYIECVIPVVYALYTVALFQLPNAAFYPHLRSLTSEKLHSNMVVISVYFALEVTTLLGVCLLLRWKLRVSGMYLLAFVLETHREMIQAKLFVWVTYSLTYGLEHAGMEFASLARWLSKISS